MSSDSFDGLPPNFAAVSNALEAFVNAPFQRKRAILEYEQYLLLTDVADYLATKLIEMNRNSHDPDAQRAADHIEAHRNMLRRCREFGISSVWSELEARSRTQEQLSHDGDPQSILLAFMAFNKAPFNQKRLVLEQEQLHLLTDTAEQMLTNLIGEVEQSGDVGERDAIKHWKALRYLLHRAHKVGIAVAWEELEARENILARIEQEADLAQLSDAIMRFAGLPSSRLREALEHEQDLLLTDSSEHLIDLLIQQAQQNDESDFANQLTAMRILIHRAREIGIDAAFKEIEEVDISLLEGLTPSDLLPVLKAVEKFIFAYEPEEIRSVLENYTEILLSDIAERVLKQHILEAKRQGQDQDWIERLERHLVLFRTMRNSGVEATIALMNTVNRPDETSLEDGPSKTNTDDLMKTFYEWTSIPVYREQRRFLETHPVLLDRRFDALLQVMLERDKAQEEALREQQKEISPVDAQATQMIRDHIALLRDIRARGGTIQAIREGYVNAHTGCALDLPTWLESIEEQYQVLIKRDEPSVPSPETAQLLVDLLRPALVRAQDDASMAPETLAELYSRLGRALTRLDSVHHDEELEEAIFCLERALVVYTPDCYLSCWSEVQFSLGSAYFDRARSDRQDNLERARAACQGALLFFTREVDPAHWARIQQNLGAIYQKLALGNSGENLEHALNYYKAALEIFTRGTYPLDWAHVQAGLGSAYSKRGWGERKENRQLATAHLNAALEILTRERFPIEWAEVQHNLNLIIHQDTSENQHHAEILEHVLASEREILDIFTRERFPLRWASTQNSLGTLYADRTVGDSDENLQKAMAHLEATLQVYTRDTFPVEFQHTNLNLAQLAYWKLVKHAQERGDVRAICDAYALAHRYYSVAREVQVELGWLAASAQARAALQGGVNEMYMRDARCLWQIGDLRGAVVALEAGRAQALVETQAIAGVQFKDVCASHIDLFISVRQRLQDAVTGGDRLAIRTARDAFLQARQTIRAHCQPDFLPGEPTYKEIARAAAPDQALIYLVAMDHGGAAFVIPPAEEYPDADNREPIAIALPGLTWEDSIKWLELVDKEKGKLGGFRFGLEFRGIKLIAHWFSQAKNSIEEAQWLMVPLCDFPGVIPASMPTLRIGVEKLISSWKAEADLLSRGSLDQQAEGRKIRERLTTPLIETESMTDILTSHLGWFVLEAELEQVLQSISNAFVVELRQKLDQRGLRSVDQPVALIPCGRLGVLPIHAATAREMPETGEQVPFLETCVLSYQASARSLATARTMLAQLPSDGPVLAIGDPRPTSSARLVCAEAESRDIFAIARRLGRKESSVLIGGKATIEKVQDALLAFRQQCSGAWIHIASHGHADPNDPTNCYMLLSNNKKLSLADLQRERLLEGLRGFNASGCVTGLGDFETAPDELSSFAAGILQAGAPCTTVTLWSVNDRANYLLMLRYMREVLQSPLNSPARALREAVRWMRRATHKDVNNLEMSGLRDVRSLPSEEGITRNALRGVNLPNRDTSKENTLIVEAPAPLELTQRNQDATQTTLPYNHPVFWAAVVFYGV